jgi:hypothetical protein
MHIKSLAVALFTVLSAVKADNAQGQELYKKATTLLNSLRARSVALTLPPSASLFSAASYTPLLDHIEMQGTGPLVAAVKATRKLFKTDSSPAASNDEPSTWSLTGLIGKLTGSHHLLGDFGNENESTESRTRRILDGVAAGATLTRREVRFGMQQVAEMLQQAGELGEDQAWATLADLSFWGRHGADQNMSRALLAYKALADRTGNPDAQYHIGFLEATGLANGLSAEGNPAAVRSRSLCRTPLTPWAGHALLHLCRAWWRSGSRNDRRLSPLGRYRHQAVLRGCSAVLQVCRRQR